MNIEIFLLVGFLTAMLLTGDYLIKLATTSQHAITFLIMAGLMWVISIPGWYYTVTNHRIAIIGMLFSVLSLIGTTLIGIIAFQEHLSTTEWIGFGFAIVATILLSAKL